jgi:hypothetical protein
MGTIGSSRSGPRRFASQREGQVCERSIRTLIGFRYDFGDADSALFPPSALDPRARTLEAAIRIGVFSVRPRKRTPAPRHFRVGRETPATIRHTIEYSTIPLLRTPRPVQLRNGRRRWTTSSTLPLRPTPRAPGSIRYTVRPPTHASHPTGKSSTAPAKHDHWIDGRHSNRKQIDRERA